MEYYTCKYPSPCGELTIVSDAVSILELRFPGEPIVHKGIAADTETAPPLKEAVKWLDSYFSGQAAALPVLPLAPEGTPFQKQCWEKLAHIPYGKTVSYQQIAQEIALERGITKMSPQAVGQAIGRNPIPIIIPCHRVIGSNGDLTGYAGGLLLKKSLLTHEKAI